MGEILRFEKEHIPEVARLELKVLRGRPSPPGPDLIRYFEEIFFENPWRSDEIFPLVYAHGGRIVAFLGVVPRSMIFKDRPIRVAVATQFMADSGEYRGFAGVELLRRFFRRGPQDLSWTDGATDAAYATWTALGAKAPPLYSLRWTRILRLGRYLQNLAGGDRRKKRAVALSRVATPFRILADAFLRRSKLRRFEPPSTPFESRVADSGRLFECIQSIGWREILKPAYEKNSFHWLMNQAAKAKAHGDLRMATVHSPQGATAGWYVYYVKPLQEATVLQIGAVRSQVDDVLRVLIKDAWQQGCAAVTGQLVPRYLQSFSGQHCTLDFVGYGVLVHSRHPEILKCISEGEAALSRLDGEWWMRFAVENWS
jgi:hypothetical protein